MNWIGFVFLAASSFSTTPPIDVIYQVDVDQITVSALEDGVTKAGINIDFLTDSSATQRTRPLGEALAEMRAGTMRFPMGELADRYLFKYESTDQQDISRCSVSGDIIPFNWSAHVDPSDGTFPNAMTTDSFVGLVQEAGAVPFFCVGIDAILKDRSCGQTDRSEVEGYWQGYTAASKAEVYTAASNWVAYVKELGKTGAYWEIGNENYLDNPEVGGWIPEKYAEVVNDLSAIIKSVDSTAKIGCNGGIYYQSDWWDRVLPLVQDHIDFIVPHQYMDPQLNDFSYYQQNDWRWSSQIDTAIDRLANAGGVSQANRDRIFVAVTETSPHVPNFDVAANSFGKSIQLFEMLANQMESGKIKFSHVWITRYVSNNRFENGVYNTRCLLDDDNRLLPMGDALSLLNRFAKDRIKRVEDSNTLVTFYASCSALKDRITFFFVNKADSVKKANVKLQNYAGGFSVTKFEYKGTSPDDLNPQFAEKWSYAASADQVFTLQPYTISIFEIE